MNPETAARWQVIISFGNLVVLFLTFIALLLYTRYTYQMQKASHTQTQELIRQRRLSVLPAFVAYQLEPRASNRIELHNIGNGVALNVKVQDVHVPHDLYPHARITFPLELTIKRDEMRHPGVDFSGVGEGAGKNQAMNAPPILNFLNEKDYLLTLSFGDVEGADYEQQLRMSGGRCRPCIVTPRR